MIQFVAARSTQRPPGQPPHPAVELRPGARRDPRRRHPRSRSRCPTKDQFKWQRVYPEGAAYAHVTGFYSFFGAAGGLESAEQPLLSGSSDKLFYRRVSDLFTGRKPQGASLELTIDPKVQQAALNGLGNQRGAAVAIDPRTGAILAMVQQPVLRPEHARQPRPQRRRRRLEEARRTPSTARSSTGPSAATSTRRGRRSRSSPPPRRSRRAGTPPGREIPGPATLDLPQTTVNLPNDYPSACGPNGKTTLDHALTISCNTAFGWLGMNVGAAAMQSQAAKFGFGDALDIPMRVTPSQFPANPNPPQLAQSAIGQFDVRVTPLQMAMVAAGIANRGTVMKPYLVQSVLGSDLQVIESAQPEQLSDAVTPEVARQLTGMMVHVVQSGTGTAAQIPGVTVAGKTGTAQHGKGLPPHAWFIAFAPADSEPTDRGGRRRRGWRQPRTGCVGGRVAAPIAKAMMEARLNKS